MKLVGLYTHRHVPSLEANHRRFAELNGFAYEKIPVRNYYEKYRVISSLLEQSPGDVFCFIDSNTYFIEDRFTFPLPETILISGYPGEQPAEGSGSQAGMDNFFCVRAVPESRRILEKVISDLSYRYCGDRSLDARAHFPAKCVRPYLYQEGNIFFQAEIPAHADFFQFTNILTAHIGLKNATDHVSYADLLCCGGEDFPTLATEEFSIINPGQTDAMVTLHTPEIGLQGAVCERNLERYCRARGLTLYVYRRNPRAAENISATWLKPALILRHIVDHGHIAWFDSDMLISPDCDFDTSREFTAYQDMGNWRFNAGFMIFRNCPRTLAYLEAVRARCESLEDRSATYANRGDQWQFICEAEIHFPEFLPVSNRRINLLPGYEPEGEPPLLVHFVHMPTHIRARIMNCYDGVMMRASAQGSGELPHTHPTPPTPALPSKPRILVFMSDTRPLERDPDTAGYNSLAAAINARYCKRYGYDFVYFQPYLGSVDPGNPIACLDPKSGDPRHSAWAKLLAARNALAMDYDYVAYLDSDCIFTEHAPGLESLITEMKEHFIAFPSDIPNPPDLPNSGFFFVKVDDRSRNFIDRWYGQDIPEFNTAPYWEQSALWRIFRQHNVKVLRGPLFDTWMTMEGVKGQLLRHIVGVYNSLRTPYFRNHIQYYAIPYAELITGVTVVPFDTDPKSGSDRSHGLSERTGS